MRLMANQVLMRIDSLIKLQLPARCLPLLMPRRLKGKQDMAWERLAMWDREKAQYLLGFRVDLWSNPPGNPNGRSNKYPADATTTFTSSHFSGRNKHGIEKAINNLIITTSFQVRLTATTILGFLQFPE